MVGLRRSAAIVGVYEHPTRYAPDKSEQLIIAESIIGAVADAGLEKKDVDGLFVASTSSNITGYGMADYLNLFPRYVDTTNVGGASFEFHLSHAITAIATGRIRCAVIAYGSTARSGGIPVGTGGAARFGPPRLAPLPDSFEDIYGTTTVGLYGLIARRHMHEYGTRPEQLAEIAVTMRHHASMNPRAMYRDPIAVEDVLKSRMVSDPLHLLDCCVISDGGGAVVIAAPLLASSAKQKPVWVLGIAEGIAHQGGGWRDLLEIAAYQTGRPAMEMAGVTHADIDMCMIYDSFTITVLATLENLGFCRRGEGGAFVAGGRLRVDGALPINTDGGGLSSNHPGMRGIFLLIEATRQLRGEYQGTSRQAHARSAPAEPPRIALCHGTGGALGSRHSGGTAVLARD
ncbi:MAG: hypothetical protein HY683_06685 [Chloroflexi bacterium]|nr:hypothetical protein [Chloroflexota bacterium]